MDIHVVDVMANSLKSKCVVEFQAPYVVWNFQRKSKCNYTKNAKYIIDFPITLKRVTLDNPRMKF